MSGEYSGPANMGFSAQVRPRIGVNLCWLVPGDVGGSEQAVTRALHALSDQADTDGDDLEIVLFAMAAFADAHPELVERFETHLMPGSRPLSAPGRRRVAKIASKPLRVAGEKWWLPRAVERAGVDVLHDAGGTSPGRIDLPSVLGIHDIQPLDLPRNFHPLKVAWLRRVLPAAVERAAIITVPSEFVRQRVISTFAVPDDQVTVVPWTVPAVPSPNSERTANLRSTLDLPGPVVVQAGITYVHKAHATTIAAFGRIASRHPDARLVLAGGAGPAEDAVRAAIGDSPVGDRIIRTGRLDDADVAALIATATVVVVPSTYEGFGLPALEAMAAGTPVLVADAGSLPEVVGDAGVVVPPGDDAQWAIELHHALASADGWDERIAAGRARAAAFSPQRTARALLDAYAAAYRSGVDGR